MTTAVALAAVEEIGNRQLTSAYTEIAKYEEEPRRPRRGGASSRVLLSRLSYVHMCVYVYIYLSIYVYIYIYIYIYMY